MSTLYELTDNYQQLLDLAESGRFQDNEEAFHETIQSLNDAIEVKAEGYAMVDKELEATDKALSNEINRLSERRRSIRNNRKRLKETLTDEMNKVGKQNIKTDKFTIYIRQNPISVKVSDERNIPKRFFKEQQPKLNKKDLKDYLLETEEELAGVELTQTEGVIVK